MILHVPHASTDVPPDVRRTLDLTAEELALELLRITDAWTVELFAPHPVPGVEAVVFPVSRLVVDPERFVDDAEEPMAAKGMGVVYLKTSDGRRLRTSLPDQERTDLLSRYYHPHHGALETAVARELDRSASALIVDCHSFPAVALPCERDQRPGRPEICLGTDGFHTPAWLTTAAVAVFEGRGYSVRLNMPFDGVVVPRNWLNRDPAVRGIMIEVRRDLYMDENTGERLPGFGKIQGDVQAAISALARAQP